MSLNRKKLVQELSEVCQRYPELAVICIGFTYEADKQIVCYGTTLVPVPTRDHEEELLRDNTAKQISDLAMGLTKNVYMGR